MNVFTYGSLMYAEVIEALTACHFSFEDVALPGFERRALTGKKYPGLREETKSSVDGRLWFDVDEGSLRMLDLFEDPLYERRSVEIMSKSRGLIEARAYVVPPKLERTFAPEPWDKDAFEANHLEQYVSMCRRFRAAAVSKNASV
jgi:gamma-glutamylcyclotransferase (GGCT)/AIG2-like uncharacterized protein YtfP